MAGIPSELKMMALLDMFSLGADAKTLVSGLVLLLILVICLTKVGENFIKFIFPKTVSEQLVKWQWPRC